MCRAPECLSRVPSNVGMGECLNRSVSPNRDELKLILKFERSAGVTHDVRIKDY